MFSKVPMVDLGWILGGDEATTWWRVSRMEVREGMMYAPEVVVSQYCLFCTVPSKSELVDGPWIGRTHCVFTEAEG